MDPLTVQFSNISTVHKPLSEWQTERKVKLLKPFLKNEKIFLRIIISGLENSGRKTLASCLSSKFGMQLLAVDADHVNDFPATYLHCQRLGLLNEYAILWYGEKISDISWTRKD